MAILLRHELANWKAKGRKRTDRRKGAAMWGGGGGGGGGGLFEQCGESLNTIFGKRKRGIIKSQVEG